VECPSCCYTIAPGLAILLRQPSGQALHCPYCVYPLPSAEASQLETQAPAASNVSVLRLEARRRTREQLVETLQRNAADGHAHCPLCDGILRTNEELLLRTSERFDCPTCGSDLAHEAYRRFAYREERWFPLIELLGEAQAASPSCQGCQILRALATACERALAHLAKAPALHRVLLQTLLLERPWAAPACNVPTECPPARQYRSLAGEAMTLL
jgi:hypothetical protein